MTKLNLSNFQPPLLARGSFHPDTHVGCIMNLMCWVRNVPADQVDDEPKEMYEPFRDYLIGLNDNICWHLRLHEFSEWENSEGEITQLNCPSCSDKLLFWTFNMDNSERLFGGWDENLSEENQEITVTVEEYWKMQGLLNEVQMMIWPANSTKLGTVFDQNEIEKSYLNLKRKDALQKFRDMHLLTRSQSAIIKAAFEKDMVRWRAWHNGATDSNDQPIDGRPTPKDLRWLDKPTHTQWKVYNKWAEQVDAAMDELSLFVLDLNRKYFPGPSLTDTIQDIVPEATSKYGINV